MEDDALTYADGMVNSDLHELFARPDQDDLATMARNVLVARDGVRHAEALVAKLKKALSVAEDDLIRLMQAQAVQSIKVENDLGVPCLLTNGTSNHYQLPAGSLEDTSVLTWIMRQGGEDLVRRTVHHASFSAFCRELVAAGKPIHARVKLVARRVVRVKEG